MDLQDLIRLVKEEWPFDKDHYPAIKKMSQKEKRIFAIRHILMQQAKALAKGMEALERFEHGLPLDEEKLRLSVRNFFINTLKMAEFVGISPDQLADDLQQWADEQYRP